MTYLGHRYPVSSAPSAPLFDPPLSLQRHALVAGETPSTISTAFAMSMVCFLRYTGPVTYGSSCICMSLVVYSGQMSFRSGLRLHAWVLIQWLQ